MNETKPVIEWLKELPDGYRERAIAQCDGVIEKCQIAYAVTFFAVWYNTKEGVDFWNDVCSAWRLPDKYPYPPIPDDGGPGCKPKRDLRLVANILVSFDYWWEIVDPINKRIIACGKRGYASKHSAKRGLIRFLKRLGVDETAVRWES